MSKPLAYSYVRMSTDIQLKGDSLRRQKEASAKYALTHNLNLIEDLHLEDIGVSAFKGANAESGSLGVFLNLVKLGQIEKGSYLLVESLDRISRADLIDSVPLFLQIIKSGINIVTLADERLYPAGEASFEQMLYSMVVLSRAHEESKTKSIRVSAAWEQKRNKLQTQKMTRVCPSWLELTEDRASYKIVSDRDVTIRRIFGEADAGYGSYAIAKKLNEENISTFGKSQGWHQSFVSKILGNRAVLGEFQPHRYVNGIAEPAGDPVPNYFPQIISEDLFLRVRAERRGRLVEGAGRRGPENRNLFSHLAKCAYCGSPMRFVNKGPGPKGGHYLRCTNSVRGYGCIATSWKYSDFETSLLYFVREIDLEATLRSAERKSDRVIIEENLRSIDEKIRELELRRDQTYNTIGSVPTDFLRLKLDECEHDIAKQTSLRKEAAERLSQLGGDSSFSSEEIKLQIVALQSGVGKDLASKRAAVSKKLRSIITTLTVAPEGDKPKIDKIKSLLKRSEVDEKYQHQLLSHINDTQVEFGRQNRSFKVVLADGVARKVIVDTDDPTRFVTQVTVDAAGNISGEGLSFPINEYENIDWSDETASVPDK
ncbi:recombinase family protein [Phyllobacterium sp. SYP-B3895]|uniref:recombinase family protein n=1 Tax=Phyllobacterium sp. SYP-B3895 TaxID=2663240 RepID=UPI001561C870|nr:recombinase family protein [Phyllobacterium sp. SYP-B3895]